MAGGGARRGTLVIHYVAENDARLWTEAAPRRNKVLR